MSIIDSSGAALESPIQPSAVSGTARNLETLRVSNLVPGIMKDMFKPCHIWDRVSSNPAGTFDTKYRYQQGAAVEAMLRKDSDPAIRVAEAESGKGMYTVVVKRGVSLRRGDVIRRDGDGLTLKITGNTIDWEAPEMSTVPIAKTTGETWEIPT